MEGELRPRIRLLLAASTGVFLGLSYPPVPAGALAFIAFLPFFVLFEQIDSAWRGFRYGYAAFFVLNVLTLYWAGGFTHGRDIYLMIAGVLLLLAHPLFFCIPVIAFVWVRRAFGYRAALAAFPFLWVGFEYLHASTELSFPWLTLANTQTYDRYAIQFISFTGSYGLTFWIVVINVLLYFALASLRSNGWKSRHTILPVGAAVLLYLIPELYGLVAGAGGINEREPGEGSQFRVGIIQPNIDPFEKWTDSPARSLQLLDEMTREEARTRPDLILWPETAIPYYLSTTPPDVSPLIPSLRAFVDSIDTPILTGAPEMKYFQAGEYVPKTSKKDAQGNSYDTYNGSLLISPQEEEIQHYEKIRLVPFAERVPFSEELSFLNAMRWNFGLGGWGIGRDTTIFTVRGRSLQRYSFANLICYESMYPGFVAGFVRKGAQFLTVITNDSWWGNTSGTYQHKQAAVLRAVENRRWIVQCANGGLSFTVDPYGRFGRSTVMYLKETLDTAIDPGSELTWYTEHGDWFAGGCTAVAATLLLGACVLNVRSHYRRKKNEDH